MKTNKLIAIINICVLLTLQVGCIGPTSQRVKPDAAEVAIEAEKQHEIALQESLNDQNRLNRVGYPILKAGLPFCEDRKAKTVGIKYVNKHDFEGEYQDIAIVTLGLSDTLKIINVVATTPAAQAGLQEGDILISVNNKNVPIGKNASKIFSELLKKETEDNTQLTFKVKRDEFNEIINVDPVYACDYPLNISNERIVNAYADGNQIVITQGMMNFAKTDDELALVVGHELAHNSMRHIDAKTLNAMGGFLVDILFAALGANTQGAFSKMASQAYSQEFESEADYVGLYINELAGYEINDAAYFWRRMGVKHPESIEKNHAASHPSPPERFVSIEDTIKEINQKKTVGENLMPNMDKEAFEKREPAPTVKL
jgi:membrane-associated protease RseP (regulator of RpoE activity)